MPNAAVVRRSLALIAACAMLALAGCGADEASARDRGGARIGIVEPTAGAVSADGARPAGFADREPGDDLTAAELAELYRTAFDQATTTHVKISSTGSTGLSAEGDVDYGSDPVRAALTATVPQLGGEVEVRLVDDVLYLRMPMLSEKFVKVDLDGAGGELGEMIPGPLDPTALLGLLEAGVGATYVGVDDSSGDRLDHYTIEVDPSALVDSLPESAGLAERLREPVSLDAWFDESGLLRTMSVDLGATAGTVEVTFTAWGQGVSIEAPPSDDVTSMPGMPQ